MAIEQTEREWVIRQGFACVWVRAPSAAEAVEIAARRLGHMGAWRTGPDVDQKAFSATIRDLMTTIGSLGGLGVRRGIMKTRGD